MVANVNFLHVRDEQATTVEGGNSTASGDVTRVLNTVVSNTIEGASLASNQITLPAGTYYIEALANTVSNVNWNRGFLYNVTDAAVEVLGICQDNDQGSGSANAAVVGIFVTTGEKVFELRHFTFSSVTGGLGLATDDGTVEVYAEVVIEQLAVG